MKTAKTMKKKSVMKKMKKNRFYFLFLSMAITVAFILPASWAQEAAESEPVAEENMEVTVTRDPETDVIIIEDKGNTVEMPPFEYPEVMLFTDPEIPTGGTIRFAISSEPANLNPVTGKDRASSAVNSWVIEGLLTRDVETRAWLPELADRWKIVEHEDYQEFYFHIDEGAYFSDGEPVTADDVVFSYYVYFDDDIPNQHQRPYFSHIEKVEKLTDHIVKFTTKDPYYINFNFAAAIDVLPQHIYEPFFRAVYKEKRDIDTVEPNLNLISYGSGNYLLKEWVKGKHIILERDKNYWSRNKRHRTGRCNFDFMVEKIIRDDKIAYEYFKKEETDYHAFTPREWVKEEDYKGFQSGRLIRMEIYNDVPRGYGYIAWNNIDPQQSNPENLEWAPHKLFGDARVRRAMTHLVDRRLFCEKLLYGYGEPTTGPYGNKSIYTDPGIEPYPFDPQKAVELLHEAGWFDTDGDRVLDKEIDGQKVDFKFTLLMPQNTGESAAFMSIVQQDMHRVGVEMNIKQVEWNSFQKLTDEKNFDAMTMNWSGTLNPDPVPIWHSSSARPGGFNMIAYSNEEVDRLAVEGISTMDNQERIEKFRRIHQILHEDQPYTFLTEMKGSLLARNNRIYTQPSNLTGKEYYRYYTGLSFWYIPEQRRMAPPVASAE